MKVAQCLIVPLLWSRPGSVDNSSDTVNAIPIYQFSQSKEEILDQNYETKQKDAALQEEHWTETVHFN